MESRQACLPDSAPILAPMSLCPIDVRRMAGNLKIALTEDQCLLLARYAQVLVEWNHRMNLTAIDDDAGVLTRHLADSLTVLPTLDRLLAGISTPRMIDVGSGAGLPGIPLKIARPQLVVDLMDSTGKKMRFCAAAIGELGLRDIQAIHGRAEEMARRRERREQYDLVIARAVAPMPTLAEYLLPFARLGGWCIAMKGAEAQTEAERAQKAITTLGGDAAGVEPVALPGAPDRRALIIIRKIRPTPDRYPRPSGAPRAAPL